MARIKDQKIIEDYLKDLDLQGATPKTIENYGSCIKVFSEWLNKRKLRLLNVNDMNNKDIIEDFLRYLRNERIKENGENISFSRIKVFFSAINSLYEYLEYNNLIKKNIILTVRKRYLKQYKNGYTPAIRKIIDVDEMSKFLNSIPNPRDKAIAMVFVKTGIRRNELIQIDVEDVNIEEMVITLKQRKFKKRSNPVVFFDDETQRILKYWLKRRKMLTSLGEKALFVGDYGGRMNKNSVYEAVTKWTKRYGLYNTKSDKIEEHFSCHNFRHCFSTYLRRNGMRKDYIQELRGDKRTEIIDIYTHIDKNDLKREYLATIPKLDVY